MAGKGSCSSTSTTTTLSNSKTKMEPPQEDDASSKTKTLAFFRKSGIAEPIPERCNSRGFYSEFFKSIINVHLIQHGRISCSLSVKPPFCNIFGTLHGGSVASLTELLSTACARTVVGEEKELILGAITMSYLSGAPINAEILADASVVKSGRNVTTVVLEFKLKKTGNLLYIAHATFYNIPTAKL